MVQDSPIWDLTDEEIKKLPSELNNVVGNARSAKKCYDGYNWRVGSEYEGSTKRNYDILPKEMQELFVRLFGSLENVYW